MQGIPPIQQRCTAEDESVLFLSPMMDGVVGIIEESGDRVLCKKYTDCVGINEAINFREEHKAIDKQDQNRLKGMNVTRFSTSVGFVD